MLLGGLKEYSLRLVIFAWPSRMLMLCMSTALLEGYARPLTQLRIGSACSVSLFLFLTGYYIS